MNCQAMTHWSQELPNLDAPIGYALKRPLDVVGALFLLTFFSPLMIFLSMLIRMSSPGPALFAQQRVGLHARPFTFYKFRTMNTQCDDTVHREYVSHFIQGSDGSPTTAFKLQSDPRVTQVGRWLRKTSLDELPQLFNVLRGDMSLVGPRPALPYEVAQYQPWHMQRLRRAKPGLTGLWQVEGRSRVPFEDMVRMDLHYASNCSLWGDLKLLARTVAVVWRGSGGV